MSRIPAEVPADVVARVQPAVLARDQRFPVLPGLEGLFPGAGIRRGSTLSVDGPAATSLALAAVAGASQDGAWVAVVGMPSLGLQAAVEYGLALDRLVLVADPGDTWSSVVAALVDAFEVVLVRASGPVRAADGRRLVARTRERGAVLVQVGASELGAPATRSVWPEGADVGLRVIDATWEGLGEGFGHLQARRVRVEAGGRREAARPRRADLWLPSPDGGVEAVLADPVPLHAEPRAEPRVS